MPESIGLVLAGGGARGAYEVGVLSVLLPWLERRHGQRPDVIVGTGFVAGVIAEGRVLLTEERGEFWMYGVIPGGLVGGGRERAAAFREFKINYLSVLFDIAGEAGSYEQFATAVRGFFQQVNHRTEELWCTALSEVRAGSVIASDLPTVIAEDQPPRLVVQLLETSRATPAFNQFDQIAEAG